MATKTAAKRDAEQRDADLLRRVNDELGRQQRKHDDRCGQFRARYKAWTGVLEREQDVWESQLAPKYAFQKIDTLIANLVDRQPKGLVLPCRPGAEDYAAAKAMEKVLNEFRRRDHDATEQRKHVQQACVMGISPRKTYWRYERGLEVWQELAQENPMAAMLLGDPSQPPQAPGLVEKRGEVTRWNQPVSRVVPVEDFFYDPSASAAEDCGWMGARYWVSPSHLKNFAEAGVYNSAAVKKACDSRSGRSSSDVGIGPDSVDRAGRIEVIEYWERQQLITIANRTCLLREQKMPYWHGELPFDLATTMPDLYRVDGFSEIELIAELQAALWDFLNQRIDNARFMSNAAVIVQEGTTITEDGFFPGAIITTDGDPARSVLPWTPPTSIIQPSLEASQELKQDIDDVTGITPYVSGAGSQTLDQQTATQISTFQSMAARRLESKRTQLFESERERGIQRLALVQQFLTVPVQIRGGIMPAGDAYDWTDVYPQDIVRSLLEYEIDETNESMDRQQRRTEAMSLATLGLQMMPGAQAQQTIIDQGALFKRVLVAFDVPPEEIVKAMPIDPMAALLQNAGASGFLAGPGAGGAGQPLPPDSGNGSVVPLLGPPPGVLSA